MTLSVHYRMFDPLRFRRGLRHPNTPHFGIIDGLQGSFVVLVLRSHLIVLSDITITVNQCNQYKQQQRSYNVRNMASSSGRPRNVEVSIEKLLEHEIEEISHNGEEKYRKYVLDKFFYG